MAARKKPTGERQTAAIQIRVTPAFKARLDKWAEETGVSVSERGRTVLEEQVAAWEKAQLRKEMQ